MFDLKLFSSPRALKRDFLQSTDVAPQSMGPELRSDFERIRVQNADLLISGNFWWDFMRTYARHLTLIVSLRGVGSILILASVLASQRILDETNTLTASLWLLFFYGLIQLVHRVTNAYVAMLQNQILVCVRTFVTVRMNWKLLRMGSLSSAEFSTGNLKTLISSDIYRIAEFLGSLFRNGIPCLLGLIFLGPVIWFYMGIPGIVAVATAFAALPLALIFGRYVFHKEEIIKRQEDSLATIVGEWVTHVRLLRYLGWEKLLASKVAGHIRKLVIEVTKQHGVNLVNFGISVSWWLMPIIPLIYTADVMEDTSDLSTLFASIWMLNHITLYIRWLPGLFISYGAAAACILRLNRLFSHSDIEDELLPPCNQALQGAMPTKLHFNHVSFAYEEKEALTDLDLTLDLSRYTSLIGTVGSGKSTLLKLICAEVQPTAGKILVEFDNGVIADLRHHDVYAAVRRVFGYMPQEAYLSNATLAVNISLDEHHSDQEVMQAIHLAELAADITHWDSGIREEVGETGVNLSGGQKQRVNLARALYSGRPYLVLDDPLSAVDTNTESALMQSMLNQCGGFLLSSHRLTELKKTDRLLVLHDGKVIEDGSPTTLAEDPFSEFSKHLRAAEVSHVA
ncbi:MAG: ATP-binding cassette domain-containing protein [Pseudomonadales bacterium]|jgi:ATP-binding cassette subfamily B protein|nr:ATP-binding cassette domain-containing protein [Pseudomonadales bacterium]MDP7357012.1 ATP-binding cassette domain-containing protein [Pseudomonadales bacterium]MDP7596066.1 ATP-binding cassette domain-containing protein [Pseudomonadales bacterium]HJN50555.1 ATP-binding cassette domain-containing protein [Pseudomonadales bacterium]|tara:strand:+ start:292 stop:2163 length:1872 start_codon:yes stop_codon:yes gene_type:complete